MNANNMKMPIKLSMTSEVVESHIMSPYKSWRGFVFCCRSFFTVKPRDPISKLTYVLMDLKLNS